MLYFYDLLEELPDAVAAPTVTPYSFVPGALAHIRKGPLAHALSPLNASLPAPPAVVTITGGTLPFMGVG